MWLSLLNSHACSKPTSLIRKRELRPRNEASPSSIIILLDPDDDDRTYVTSHLG